MFPWILQQYDSETLDLKDKSIYRDLSKVEDPNIITAREDDSVLPDLLVFNLVKSTLFSWWIHLVLPSTKRGKRSSLVIA